MEILSFVPGSGLGESAVDACARHACEDGLSDRMRYGHAAGIGERYRLFFSGFKCEVIAEIMDRNRRALESMRIGMVLIGIGRCTVVAAMVSARGADSNCVQKTR